MSRILKASCRMVLTSVAWATLVDTDFTRLGAVTLVHGSSLDNQPNLAFACTSHL